MKRVFGGTWPLVLLLAAVACEDEPELPPLEIVTKALPDVALGAAYDQKIEIRGGTTPYAFQIKAGSLPDGLSLASATGQITGLAGSPGAHGFTIEVRAAGGLSTSAQLSIYVTPDPLVVETAVLAEAQETITYEHTLVARGGLLPYVWSTSSGAWPPGLVLSDDGRISGAPTAVGVFALTVRVTDAEAKTAERTLSLVVRSLDPMIRTSSVPDARFGHGMRVELEAEGGRPPYSWSKTGALPTGVSLDADGVLSGVPITSGDFPFVVKVTDSGARTDEAMLTLHVKPPLLLVTTRIPQVLANRLFEFQLEASGGQPPYQWRVISGQLQAGLSLESSGSLHGTVATGSRTTVTIAVVDALGDQKAASFAVEVNDRYTYSVNPLLMFPASCSATVSASFASVTIPVTDSLQIDDLDVEVDLDYTDPTAPSNNRNKNLKLVLIAPNGQRAVLCGGAAGLRQEPGCRGSNGIHTSYDDLTNPFTPLRVFKGMNPQGDWTLLAIIPRGEFGADACRQSGTINSVSLEIREDAQTSPYVRVTGYDTNELIIDPYVRVRFYDSVPEREIFLSATMYDVGQNGRREGGGGDDVPDPSHVFTWSYDGSSSVAITVSPDGHVEGGAPDRTCLLLDTRRCGTGEGEVVADDGQGTEVRRRVLVVPPDWNPLSRVF